MSNNINQIFKKALSENRTLLLEPEAKDVIKAYGIPVTKHKVSKTPEEAAKFAQEIGYPVVMKIVSRDVVHKSDSGGVKINIKNAEEAKKAYQEIQQNVRKAVPNYKFEGIIIEEFAPEGREVIVGMTKDPQFGPALAFGLGGIFVEVLKDVSFRVAPITKYDAEEMIQEIKGYPILKGVRGQKPVDFEAIINILLNVSKLVMDHPEINEMDLNPVITYPDGAKTVDARIILSKE
ncbi:MAG: acetate--CoA ligase family protein [Candidatus Freyarchaeum deiterrae]